MRRRLFAFLFAWFIIGGLIAPAKAVSSAVLQAGAVTTSSANLNVRAGGSTNAPVVSTLKKGSYITLVSKSGDWWKVEYEKGKYGYCHGRYITVVEGRQATVSTSGGNLNVRSGAGMGYSVMASLAKGERVLLLSSSNGWSRILYHGTKTGYVSSQYVTGSASAQYPAVSLSVPSFKQTDSRWANVTIGSSGKTMSRIGCATTAIAMMESHRTGSIIYPDAMSKRLSYTATGNVYWPAHYTVKTDGRDYLSKIYQLLQAGKPVLFGAKTNSGSQHWVVITGYTGGSQLTTAGFTIHDPGSHSRTTLQQFLQDYPVFYKYFHY